ncbi:MAG: LacI family transcriptional regulator [Corallococcus sp.]|nr:LacI family transcriptional regulator [Corallococcus sp.]MCM1359818.1 LacI family transcriptional regulator [Corallococcus sp.]MCM1395252.1 LacI family transcriptional regulator [Corallococcus sp.]
MRITIKDIAEMCGVSVTTVSLVLNNKKVRTSVQTKQKILEIAQKYNYTPNSLAVGLVTRRTNTIALLIPDISNVFFSQIAKHLESNFGKYGYNLILCNTNDNAAEQEKYLQLLLNRGVDALVMCVANDRSKTMEILDDFAADNVPVIAFDRSFDNLKCPLVVTDNKNGAKDIVEYLIGLGHKRIACISGSNARLYSERLDGYKQALSENGIEYDGNLVRNGDYRYESGYLLTKELLCEKPTAIFVCNDMMAYGAYKAIEENGLSVPDDISVVGFDDLMFSSLLSVPLTTVRQDVAGMCAKICNLTLNALHGESVGGVHMLPATVMRRESVKKLQ